MAICFTFKLFADGVKFTNIHGWDLEGSGRLFETVLERIQLGTLIPHILLMNQCFFNEMWRTLAINVIVIIYVIVLQVFMYKNRMANLKSIMRITGKVEFKKTSNLDVAYWVYRYSHPYIRVLGLKRAMTFMNDINSPISLDSVAQNSARIPRRFNIPIYDQDGSPLRSAKKDSSLTELRHDQEVAERLNVEPSSSRRNLEFDRKFSLSNSKINLPDDLASIKLELPINGKEDSAKSENHFGSNSHFRKDGMLLDFASSPTWKQIEKSALEFNSFPGSNPLKVIEEKKDDSQFELDHAHSRDDDKIAENAHRITKSEINHDLENSQKIEKFQLKAPPKLNDMDVKPPSLLDIRTNKIVSPIPLTLSRKNKSEGKFSLLAWKKMLQSDKQMTEHQEENSKDMLSVPKHTNPDADSLASNFQDSIQKQPIETSAKLIKSELS